MLTTNEKSPRPSQASIGRNNGGFATLLIPDLKILISQKIPKNSNTKSSARKSIDLPLAKWPTENLGDKPMAITKIMIDRIFNKSLLSIIDLLYYFYRF